MDEPTKRRVTQKSRTLALITDAIFRMIDDGNLTPSINATVKRIVDDAVGEDAPSIVRDMMMKELQVQVERYWREASHIVAVDLNYLHHPVTHEFYKHRKALPASQREARRKVAGMAKGRGGKTAGTRFLTPLQAPSDDMMLAVYLRGFSAVHAGQRNMGLRLLEMARQAKLLTPATSNQLLLELQVS